MTGRPPGREGDTWGAWLGPSQALATSQPQAASPHAPVHSALQGGSGGSARSHQPGLGPVSVGRLQTRPEGTGPHGDLRLTAECRAWAHTWGVVEKADHALLWGVEEGCSHRIILAIGTEQLQSQEREQASGTQCPGLDSIRHQAHNRRVRLLSWRGGRTQEPDPGPVRASEAIWPGRGCMASLSLGYVGIQRLTFGARSHSSLGRLWVPAGLDKGRGSMQSCVG